MAKVGLHLHIKDHMTIHVLIAHWRFVALQYLEGYLHTRHFLFDCIVPESVPVLFINFKRTSYCLGYFNTKLMGAFNVTLVDGCDDTIPFPQDVRYPPRKGRHAINAVSYGILSDFNGI